MRVWKLSVASDSVWVTPESEWSDCFRESFDGRSWAQDWVPQKIVRLEAGVRPLSDAPHMYSGLLVLSSRACDAMKGELEGSCELLPMRSDEGEYNIVNVTAVLDCIDYNFALYEKFDDGRIAWFDEYAFDAGSIGSHCIFKIVECTTSELFVTDLFKEAYEANGFAGLRFLLVWDGDPESAPRAQEETGASKGELVADGNEAAVCLRNPEAWRTAMPMQEVLARRIREALGEVDSSDVYAVSLYVESFRDNPCEPTVTLSVNTEDYFHKASREASSEEEARWNYAFWPQESLLYFGESRPYEPADDSPAIIERWVRESGFPFYDYEGVFGSDADPDDCIDDIPHAFRQELAAIVENLHASGFVRQTFGRDIPIIIHGLEYDESDAELNLAANGECAREFADFCLKC